MSDDLDLFLKEGLAEEPAVEPSAPAEPEPAAAVEAAPEPKAPEPVKGEEGAPPAPALPPRGEDGKFKKRESEPHMVPLEALLAEREKRREAESKVRQPETPKQDFWDDPEGAVKAAIEARAQELEQVAEERGRRAAREQFFTYTENAAKDRHTDYDETRAIFEEEAQRNPILIQQLAEAKDPAEFIYQQGKVAAELRSVGGDLKAYKARVEQEIRQRLEREYAGRQKKTADIPQSLNSEPSKGAGIKGGAWSGPTPIDDILPNR